MKINPDKLTDFERQLAVLFELKLSDVEASQRTLRVPGLPSIWLGRWWGAEMLCDADKTDKSYRKLSWRGQILMHQLHRRALTRAVEEEKEIPAPPVNTAAVGKSVPQLSGKFNQKLMSQGYSRGVASLYNPHADGADALRYAFMAPEVPNPLNQLFFGEKVCELIDAGVPVSVIADAKRGIPSAIDQLSDAVEQLHASRP